MAEVPAATRAPGRILWLASYPKSGNTWLRMFLANLRSGRDAPVSINALGSTPMAAGRDFFEDATGLDSSELTVEETLQLRRMTYAWQSDHAATMIPCKIHDALLTGDQLTIEPAATAGAIYVVRNPLDVLPSFADHMGLPLDAMIERMADETFGIGGRGRPQLRQHLGSWSGHVRSWIDATAFPVLTVRYEDMSADPQATFARVVSFAGVPASAEQIRQAIEFSSFAEARRQERTDGFIERLPDVERFFRRGRVGAWREDLTAAQAARVVAHHRETMARLGYLDAQGEPL